MRWCDRVHVRGHGPTPKLTNTDVAEALVAINNGWPHRRIARELGVAVSTLTRTLRRVRQGDTEGTISVPKSVNENVPGVVNRREARPDNAAEAAWSRIQAHVKAQPTTEQARYERWLEPLREASLEGTVLVVAVRSEISALYVQDRFAEAFGQALEREQGLTALKFEVATPR